MRDGKIKNPIKFRGWKKISGKSKTPRNKKILISLIAVIAISSLFLAIAKIKKKSNEPAYVEVVRSRDFSDRSAEFSDGFLKAAIMAGEGNIEAANKEIGRSGEKWALIIADFKDDKPEQCRSEKDWQASLNRIDQSLKTAADLSYSGKNLESFVAWQETGAALGKLHVNCGISIPADKLFDFYIIMRKTLATDDRSEAVSYLPDLKMKLTELKELKIDDRKYQDYLAAIGAAISRIENSTPKVFDEFKQDLRPAFLEIQKELQ